MKTLKKITIEVQGHKECPNCKSIKIDERLVSRLRAMCGDCGEIYYKDKIGYNR